MLDKSDIKKLIREVIQEVQWDRQTPEGRAKEDDRVDKVFKDTISGLQKQIAAGKQKEKAGKIINKKPFKKPFEEAGGQKLFGVYHYDDPNKGWGFAGWQTFVMAKDENDVWEKIGGYSMGLGIKEVKNKTKLENDFKKKIKEYAALLKSLQGVSSQSKPKKEKPMSKADLVNMDPGRSSMGGPTSGW